MTSPSTRPDDSATESRSAVARLALALVLLSLPALFGRGAMAEAARAASVLSDGGAPATRDLLLAFALSPLVALSAGVLFLSPGLLLTRLSGRAGTFDRWLVSSLAVSLVVVSLVAAIGQWVAGTAFRGAVFGWTVVALVIALAAAGGRRFRGFEAGPSGPGGPSARGAVTIALSFPLALGVLFAPKLHWEAFNGDGAHAFESARLLLSQALPFWPEGAGHVAAFPGVSSMLYAFPVGWFLRLFGEIDAAARLPFLLYLSLLVSALAWVISAGRPGNTLAVRDRLLLVLAVLVYGVAMAWSATYSPYSADLALPAAQDTLLLVVFLGFVASFVERDRARTILFAILTFVSLPSGLLLMAFWLAAILLAWRPVPRQEAKRLGALLVGLVAGSSLLPRLLVLAGAPRPGSEYGAVGILRYFAFLRFTDLERLVWVALPCGIAPIVAACLWRRQDRVARALSLVSGAYFLFFYVQANVSLHHFVPCMILPVAVLWRAIPSEIGARRRWVGATAVAAVVSLVLVWPAHAAPQIDGRRVGEAFWNRVGGYDRSSADSFAAVPLMNQLFPLDWSPAVPGVYGGSPLVWHRYARNRDGVGVNYVLQRASDDAPSGAHLLAQLRGFALYVRSDSVWEEHRHLRPPTPAGSRWLAVPRSTLFRSVPPDGDTHVIDVAHELQRAGFPVDALLRFLGVER